MIAFTNYSPSFLFYGGLDQILSRYYQNFA